MNALKIVISAIVSIAALPKHDRKQHLIDENHMVEVNVDKHLKKDHMSLKKVIDIESKSQIERKSNTVPKNKRFQSGFGESKKTRLKECNLCDRNVYTSLDDSNIRDAVELLFDKQSSAETCLEK